MRISLLSLPFEKKVEMEKEYNLDYLYFLKQLKMGNSPLNFDADSERQFRRMVRKLRKSKYNTGHCRIFWRRSSSRRGYHMMVLKDWKLLFLPSRKILRIRRIYNDCLGRIFCDRQRVEVGLPISILFDTKNSRKATAWRDLGQLKWRR